MWIIFLPLNSVLSGTNVIFQKKFCAWKVNTTVSIIAFEDYWYLNLKSETFPARAFSTSLFLYNSKLKPDDRSPLFCIDAEAVTGETSKESLEISTVVEYSHSKFTFVDTAPL